jgi:hypothetical protein
LSKVQKIGMDEPAGYSRMLFLGNSHTYRHDVPRLLASLVKASVSWKNLDVEINAGAGVSLEWHWQNERSRALIAQGIWDYVVLQEKSSGPLDDPDSMFQNARKLNDEILENKGKAALYMTWANRDRRETQGVIADAYERTASELGAKLIPVGRAWDNALMQDPGLALYDEDGRHSSEIGAYLAACVFYASIYGASPEGLPGRLLHRGEILSDLSVSLAAQLQKIARQTISI